MDIMQWLVDNRFLLVGVVVTLGLLALLQRIIGGLRRRSRPTKLHPKLQAYAGRSADDIEAERIEAEKIIATSSTNEVAGYEIRQQIEAVFVDGLRTPREAVTALKAEAGRKGANAVINLTQSRTSAGRCTAQGDAVLIRPIAGLDRRSGG